MSNFMLFAARDHDATRSYEEENHEFRTKFERDRDRILYSKEFRRLSGKTQVFVAGSDDNVRTRLTHTLEVAQVASTIARHLNLDEILTEAISYGHDLGHTPFGVGPGDRTWTLDIFKVLPITQVRPQSLFKESDCVTNAAEPVLSQVCN